MKPISERLHSLDLDQYAKVFTANNVDFDALMLLAEKDLWASQQLFAMTTCRI